MDVDLPQLQALAAVVSGGTFEAAARFLHVTPSAISQRIRALEVSTGQVLVVRARPVRVTAAGEVLLRVARQIDLLLADAVTELAGDPGDPARRPPVVPVAVNADSLATWFLPAVAPLAASLCLDVHRADQSQTASLLREGTVMAAVTSEAAPVPGCSSTPLGGMRYRPMAARTFAARWFPDGPTPAALRRAPVVVFDGEDDLQHRYLRRRLREHVDPPVHHVPTSADFLTATRLGFGWAVLPGLQVPDDDPGLVVLDPAGTLEVPLHWQQWKLRSRALDGLGNAVRAAAARALAPA